MKVIFGVTNRRRPSDCACTAASCAKIDCVRLGFHGAPISGREFHITCGCSHLAAVLNEGLKGVANVIG